MITALFLAIVLTAFTIAPAVSKGLDRLVFALTSSKRI